MGLNDLKSIEDLIDEEGPFFFGNKEMLSYTDLLIFSFFEKLFKQDESEKVSELLSQMNNKNYPKIGRLCDNLRLLFV